MKRNPEKARQYCKRWPPKVREKINASKLAWKRNNPEKVKASYRKHYVANRETIIKHTTKRSKQHPERMRMYRLKSVYKLTAELLNQKMLDQDYKCAICKSPFIPESESEVSRFVPPNAKVGWMVDHDHSCCSGRRTCGQCVRDILCPDCNHVLGAARDSLDRLKQAVAYIEKWKSKFEALLSSPEPVCSI